MDPITNLPLEVSLAIFKNLELEELLLSTRFTSRTWNDMLSEYHVAHLMVSSYFLRLDLGRARLDIALSLRHGPEGLEIYGESLARCRVHEEDDVRYFPVSAGIIHRQVSRTFMSNPSHPTLIPAHSPIGDVTRASYAAQIDAIHYSNPFTNTGKLNTIALNLAIAPIFEADSDVPSMSRVTCSLRPAELAKWIVLCRLAQGYQTPAEIREFNRLEYRLCKTGVVGPYRSFKNSAGIWGRAKRESIRA